MEAKIISKTLIIFLLLVSLSNLAVYQCAPLSHGFGHLSSDIDAVVKEALDKLEGMKTSVGGKIECDVCKLIVGTAQKLFKEGKSWDDIAAAIGDMCYLFKIKDKNVCTKITHEFEVRSCTNL